MLAGRKTTSWWQTTRPFSLHRDKHHPVPMRRMTADQWPNSSSPGAHTGSQVRLEAFQEQSRCIKKTKKTKHHLVAEHLFSTTGGRCPVTAGKQTTVNSEFHALCLVRVQREGGQRQTDRRLTVHRSHSSRLIRCLSCGRRDRGSGGSSSPEWSNQDSRTEDREERVLRPAASTCGHKLTPRCNLGAQHDSDASSRPTQRCCITLRPALLSVTQDTWCTAVKRDLSNPN